MYKMTHDELLEEIDEAIEMAVFEERCGCGGGWSRGAKALRAVVELHKPDFMGECMAAECERECHQKMGVQWPCPTIQAIEKELA
jgi:hypothetical protein